MSKQIIADALWGPQINDANKYYDAWANLFRCSKLEEYYEGKQYQDQDDDGYVINKVYENVQIKIDSYCPTTPRYIINPRPGNSDYDLETASRSASIKQDVLNSLISNDAAVFIEETKHAYKESYFRFGVVEVGYAADWVLNPNVDRPLLVQDVKEYSNDKPRRSGPPPEVPANERVYIKYIDSKRFRVGGQDHRYLHRCDWYGYYEYVRKEDLLAMDGLLNRSEFEMGGGKGDDTPNRSNFGQARENKTIGPDQTLKIWHIWHNKAKVRLIIVDSPTLTIYQRPFTRQSVFDYRHDMRVVHDGFYPIPPVFHWISPQNELNEIREQLRAHRRKYTRKFQVVEDFIEDDEIQKFETGPDGSLIKVKKENAISLIQDGNLGSATGEMAQLASSDINELSATSANARGLADRTTATEADYINQRVTIRETAEQKRVGNWLGRVGRAILLICRDRFSYGVWAELTSDNKESMFQELQSDKKAYDWVTSEDLSDGYDFRVEVDITSISLQAQEAEKKKFFEFIAFVSQYPAVAMSPTLIRQAAYTIGFRNEKIIKEMQQMALLQQAGQMAGLAGMQNGNAGQQQMAQATPNMQEQIRQKVSGKVLQ